MSRMIEGGEARNYKILREALRVAPRFAQDDYVGVLREDMTASLTPA